MDNSKPIISVITVAFNAHVTIESTLRSVIGQKDCVSFEYIIIDGGSSDGTKDVIEQNIVNSIIPIKYLSEKDNGIFDAMNKAVSLASSDYCLFLNADDFLISPFVIKNLTDLILSYKEHVLICGEVLMGRIGTWGFYRSRCPFYLNAFTAKFGFLPPHQGLVTPVDLIKKSGGFSLSAGSSSDSLIFYEIMNRFNPQIVLYKNYVSFMRMGGESNADLRAYLEGNSYLRKILIKRFGLISANIMIFSKLIQKILEIRYGYIQKQKIIWF